MMILGVIAGRILSFGQVFLGLRQGSQNEVVREVEVLHTLRMSKHAIMHQERYFWERYSFPKNSWICPSGNPQQYGWRWLCEALKLACKTHVSRCTSSFLILETILRVNGLPNSTCRLPFVPSTLLWIQEQVHVGQVRALALVIDSPGVVLINPHNAARTLVPA
uniref:Uncharacterized protein n=1 Tax=Physcomitrium patens TaxID=3218 RepID=A0A2K1JE47_PHYPA|nr:hypothetical protein PHYPA_020087 [Physcomitrium patens]